MSASLVGSEMCIRDSFSSKRRLGQPGGHFGPDYPMGDQEPRKVSPHAGTVSYTHLTLPTICSV
eukprot:11563593-Alexandrium_andersonii.AAC.1